MTNIQELIDVSGDLVSNLIIIVAGLALVVFFWGLARFLFRLGGDEKAVEEGKNIMKWGILAIFVMFSIWGIINFAWSELGLSVPECIDALGMPVDCSDI